MNIYDLTRVILFAISAWGCSLPPNVPYYTIADRAVLAPIIIHGRVLNISTPTRQNAIYKACVEVLEVIKGDRIFTKHTCFGKFGGDYLCLTNVYENVEYIFFMNSDGTARYKDGVPISAFFASKEVVSLAKQGYCNPYQPHSMPCERPTITKKNYQSFIQVKEGERAIMSCYASGTAPLLYLWSKRGAGYGSGFVRNTLNTYQIEAASSSDSGVYICIVRNPAGETKVLVTLYVEPVPCGGFVVLTPGQPSQIKTPNYPQPYSKDKACSWRICPSPGQRVKLEFKHFDLDRNLEDNIQIYHECDHDWSMGVIKHCSLSNPGTLVSKCTSNCVNVWFQSMNVRGYASSRGFHATVTSTDEGTSLFDYKRFYCNNDILLRYIPREAYFSSTSGRVLDNYKSSGPRPGQNINIKIRSSTRNVFGCFTEFKANKEYYIGLTISPVDGSYRLRFAMLTDAENKPEQFDQQLNKLKTAEPVCLPAPSTAPPVRPKIPTTSRPTDPPRTDPPRTDPPRTDPPRTDPPRPPVIPTEVPEGPQERPSPRGTPNPLDP